RHYVYLFQANAFISSELSNHVIASRVFSNKLSSSISKTPLYLLQHGIMFAKPVDNPIAMGFHKENVSFNLKKNVISSDLEAKEFYKMGYCSEDLMKTGLPKLDNATLDESADKIAYMPTWRYWEESYIINNEIEKTTYFESIMNLIDLFEKEGLLDKLLITPHNKFVEYVAIHLQKYEDILCKDPKEALEKSRIFITDYSSAIYDSIYRGAYPIFYWKDSHYLIENYKAIPPINNDNAPGMLEYTDKELINAISHALSRNNAVPSEVINKYRKINEYHDGNNSNRVIKELTKNGVL